MLTLVIARRACTGLLILLAALAVALSPRAAWAQEAIPAVSGTSDAFVEARVEKPAPWVGEQVTYIFRYYEAVDGAQLPSWIRPPDYEAPEFSGFWVEGEPATEAWTEVRDGRTYNVAELRTVLFPTSSGELTIPPAKLILYDLLAGGERTLETIPVTLDVQALPPGAPSGFEGAVGALQLSAQTDRTSAPVGEPIQLRLTLTGQGNLRLAPAPLLRDVPGWRVLERGSDVLTEVVDGVGGGTRTFDFLLFPSEPGSATIPPIELAYIDPAAGEYRTAQTPPIVLTAEGAPPTVTPTTLLTTTTGSPEPLADEGEPDAALSPADGTGAGEPAAKLASGAHALALLTPEGAPPAATVPLARSPIYWGLWLLPAAALVLGISVRRQFGAPRGARRAAQQAERTRARAGRDTLLALGPPAAYPTPHEAGVAAYQALGDYVRRKVGPGASGTRAALQEHLRSLGAPQHLVERLLAMLRQSDQARYAPLAIDWPSAQQIHADVTALIREMDSVLR